MAFARQLYYILEPGEMIGPSDEVLLHGRWQLSGYIGKPVIRGVFRRAATTVDKDANSTQQAQPAMALLQRWIDFHDGASDHDPILVYDTERYMAGLAPQQAVG